MGRVHQAACYWTVHCSGATQQQVLTALRTIVGSPAGVASPALALLASVTVSVTVTGTVTVSVIVSASSNEKDPVGHGIRVGWEGVPVRDPGLKPLDLSQTAQPETLCFHAIPAED